jgi:hypothetical protein
MGNLHASSINPTDPRPFQVGRVEGTKHNRPVRATKEWLVDTGASISAITKSNADRFDLTPLGGSASGTTGGGGILIKTGLTVIFTVLQRSGYDGLARSALPIGVKPNDFGSEILGMDRLAACDAKVRRDPSARDGDVYE